MCFHHHCFVNGQLLCPNWSTGQGLRDEYARREGRAIALEDHDNFTLPAGHRRSHPAGLKITVRKSHVAKVKDEFRTAQLSLGALGVSRVSDCQACGGARPDLQCGRDRGAAEDHRISGCGKAAIPKSSKENRVDIRALHSMLAASRWKSTVAATANRQLPFQASPRGAAGLLCPKRELGDRALLALLFLRCLRAVPGKGRFRLVPWQMTDQTCHYSCGLESRAQI